VAFGDDAGSGVRKALRQEHDNSSAMLAQGRQQLQDMEDAVVRLQSEYEKLSSELSHENEKGDLLLNILGSLLQEVGA
jgi:hypothetical protein